MKPYFYALSDLSCVLIFVNQDISVFRTDPDYPVEPFIRCPEVKDHLDAYGIDKERYVLVDIYQGLMDSPGWAEIKFHKEEDFLFCKLAFDECDRNWVPFKYLAPKEFDEH